MATLNEMFDEYGQDEGWDKYLQQVIEARSPETRSIMAGYFGVDPKTYAVTDPDTYNAARDRSIEEYKLRLKARQQAVAQAQASAARKTAIQQGQGAPATPPQNQAEAINAQAVAQAQAQDQAAAAQTQQNAAAASSGPISSAVGNIARGAVAGATGLPVAPTAPTSPATPSDGSSGGKGILDLIARYESNGLYGAVFGNANAQNNFPDQTIGQVVQDARGRAKKSGSSATGRYQILAGTMESVAQKLGLSLDTPMTNDVQDQMGIQLLKDAGLDQYEKGQMTASQFADNLAGTWAIFGNSKGESIGNHKPIINHGQITKWLEANKGNLLSAVVGGLGGKGGGGGQQGTPISRGNDDLDKRMAAYQAAVNQLPAEKPNYWDKMIAAGLVRPGGLMSLIAPAGATGAGWIKQPQQVPGVNPIDMAKAKADLAYKKAQTEAMQQNTEMARGDRDWKRQQQQAAMGLDRDRLALDRERYDRANQLARDQFAFDKSQAQLAAERAPGSPASIQAMEAKRAQEVEQAGRDLQAGWSELQNTRNSVLEAWDRSGGRGWGKRVDRATAGWGPMGDDTTQNDIKRMEEATVMDMLDKASTQISGPMTEKEWDMLRKMLPQADSPRQSWEEFFNKAERMLLNKARKAGVDVSALSQGSGGGGVDQYYR